MDSNKEQPEITETDKQIFEAINKNDVVLLKTLLANVKNVNIVDENSMTPLQHAAYKGNKEIVQILLDQGADVNHCEHQHNYSALHFAGLSGNSDVCLSLLLAGAKSQVLNTVGRTASQMAAFTGNHNCVAVINNYIPKSEVDYYTEVHGLEQDPALPPFLSDSFHKFVMQVNIHPVKVVLNLYNFIGLSEHLEKVKKVLELMSDKEMKRGAEMNEVMSFKFHYLSCVAKEVIQVRQRQSEAKNGDEMKLDITELFTRRILKPNKDGNLEYMDNYIRECIREFPFRESTLFRQMVASLASKDPPSALSIVNAAINGQRGFVDNVFLCNTCGEEKPLKKCSKCKVVQYCDRNCQRLHWHWHKKACPRLSQTLIDNDKKPDAAQLSAELQNLLVNDN